MPPVGPDPASGSFGIPIICSSEKREAAQNLPQYALRICAQGDIYADGVDKLLYGCLSNVL